MLVDKIFDRSRGLTGPRISDAWALGKSSRRSDAGEATEAQRAARAA